MSEVSQSWMSCRKLKRQMISTYFNTDVPITLVHTSLAATDKGFNFMHMWYQPLSPRKDGIFNCLQDLHKEKYFT